MTEELKLIITVVAPLIAVALAFAGLRHAITTLEGSLVKAEQNRRDENGKLWDRINKIETGDSARDNRMVSLEGGHAELKQRHGEGMSELRQRTAAVEGTTAALERSTAEIRADMRNVSSIVSRMEARQDTMVNALDSLRRDVLMSMGQRTVDRERTGGAGG